jgi:hypothetical protein
MVDGVHDQNVDLAGLDGVAHFVEQRPVEQFGAAVLLADDASDPVAEAVGFGLPGGDLSVQ